LKDGTIRSRTLYEYRRKNKNIEIQRVKEIKELRKKFEKNNEIQKKGTIFLKNFLKEFSKDSNNN